MSASLHLACTEDHDAVLALVAAFHAESGFDTSAEHQSNAIKPLLEGNPYGAIYLVGPKRAPVGYIALTFGWSLEFGGMDGFIDEIYLRPSVRGRGMGRDALQKICELMAQTDLTALHLEVHKNAPLAEALYQKIGFVRREGYALMTRPIR
ncbi:MAG: GNAT family N-acetyltransferase [Pseudomonadota bacterium]